MTDPDTMTETEPSHADPTRARRARAQAPVSEARLLGVLDTAVDGIIVINDAGTVLVYNAACEALFGFTSEEIIGHNIARLMPHEYARDHDAYIDRYKSTGERRIIGIGREVRGQHKDGTVFPIELSVGEALTDEGRQFIGVIRDLRPRKAVEQRLAQVQAQLVGMARINAMDEMGAAVAHELNQPLTAMMLYLQAVNRKLAGFTTEVPQIAGPLDILGRALKEAERASNIIQRMRQFVEKREPERQQVSLEALIDEALELTLLGATSAGVRVIRENDPQLEPINADPVQIQQVLVNVLRNGLEAIKGRTERWLRVSTSVHDASVYVTIEDSGTGIPPEAMRDLFKAFSTTKRTGLGLGLAISKSLAQNHGGDLTVEPGGNGSGARFILRLPRDVGR
jgi:two-component system sensor kinase FixL